MHEIFRRLLGIKSTEPTDLEKESIEPSDDRFSELSSSIAQRGYAKLKGEGPAWVQGNNKGVEEALREIAEAETQQPGYIYFKIRGIDTNFSAAKVMDRYLEDDVALCLPKIYFKRRASQDIIDIMNALEEKGLYFSAGCMV